MNPIKTLLATLTLALALFAGDAFAQCAGKTVYVEIPTDNEWVQTAVYLKIDGMNPISDVTKEGNFIKFVFPSTSQEFTGTGKSFAFSNKSGESGENYWINKVDYNYKGQQTSRINCDDFVSGSYIYENLGSPGKTVISLFPPDVKYFYFLPPDHPDWIMSTPHVVTDSAVIPMKPAENMCGWYVIVYDGGEGGPLNNPVPNVDMRIWPGSANPADGDWTKQVGKGGMGEDPMDWPGTVPNRRPTPFNLKDAFDGAYTGGSPTNYLYFVADGFTDNWKTSDPGLDQKQRCSYNFAANIYYKGSVGNSFSAYPNEDAEGICKGYVKGTLGPDGKMQWNERPSGCGQRSAGWLNETDFVNAFKKTTTPYTNYPFCYNMPFQKRPNGLWEFDASYLCIGDNTPDGGKLDDYTDYSSTKNAGCNGKGSVGGFYLNVGRYKEKLPDGKDGNFIPTSTPYPGNAFIRVPSSHEWCFDRGYYGTGTGNLDSLTTAAEIDVVMTASCTGGAFKEGNLQSYDTGNEGVGTGNTGLSDKLVGVDWEYPKEVTGLMCFESAPAEITYEPGQEFFFRGDDDIWVFINNKLVIDLGGNHMPAPGYVKLDTIGKNPNSISTPLVPGQKYPINVFFCDRRASGSNVRITTNLYFAQKSGLYVDDIPREAQDICMQESSSGSCGGQQSEKCGCELGPELEYFIVRRGADSDIDSNRVYLNESNTQCDLKDPGPGASYHLSCFNGAVDIKCGNIKVAREANGSLSGTWFVYSAIKNEHLAKYTPAPAPANLATIYGESKVVAAWNINERKDVLAPKPGGYVASNLVPVAFTVGSWIGSSFTPDLDEAKGQKFNIIASSQEDPGVPGSYLRVYRDAAGAVEVKNPRTEEFEIPPEGILVLWFTGSYEASGTATYSINAKAGEGEKPFNLMVHQPKIEFVRLNDAGAVSEIINTRTDPLGWGSDPSKGNTPADRAVYVALTLKRNIAAYDPTVTPNIVCETCNFTEDEVTKQKAWLVSNGAEAGKWDNYLSLSGSMSKGVGQIGFSGKDVVTDNLTVSFKVGGPSPQESTHAQWDSLQFKEPPVPYPVHTAIYDKNGDGIGDSIRITYNKKFPKCSATGSLGCELDSLPNYLQIAWDIEGEQPIGFGHANARQNANGEYDNKSFSPADNWSFWEKYVRQEDCAASGNRADPGLIEAGGLKCQDTIVISGIDFSKEIKTMVLKDENVISWATFEDEGSEKTFDFPDAIQDGIPPIIVLAEYEGEEGASCSESSKCRDNVYLTLSEPVVLASGKAEADVDLAFAYKLSSVFGGEAKFQVHKQAKSLPNTIKWALSRAKAPSSGGDESVTLSYLMYKVDENNSSFTPVPGDSVRLLEIGGSPLAHALTDLAGNYPNPNEIGRRIEGRGRFNTDKNLIAGLDPDKAKDNFENAVDDRFGGGNTSQETIDRIKELFCEKNSCPGGKLPPPVGLLPIPPEWKGGASKDSISANYPGTVGTVFWPDIKNTIDKLESDNDLRPGEITPDNISLVANSFYHTNLGNYTAKSGSLRVKCSDPIFKIDGQGSCLDGNGFYLGWNLKDDKGRWAGTGAYVQVYNFRWEVSYSSGGKKVSGTYDKYPEDGNKIEMFGVRRGKSKK